MPQPYNWPNAEDSFNAYSLKQIWNIKDQKKRFKGKGTARDAKG